VSKRKVKCKMRKVKCKMRKECIMVGKLRNSESCCMSAFRGQDLSVVKLECILRDKMIEHLQNTVSLKVPNMVLNLNRKL